MDPDVVEISPPPVSSRPPRMRKHKEVILHDVIEIDKEEDSVDLMFLDEVVDKSNKGKAVKVVSDGYGDYQAEEAMVNFFGPSGVEALVSLDGVESSQGFGPANFINLDGHSSDVSCDDDDDDYIDLLSDDFMDFDEYAMLQAHFDSVDMPTGIEAPIPFLMDPPQGNYKHATGSSSVHTKCPMESYTAGLHGINSSSSSQFSMKSTSVSSPSLQIHMDTVSQPTGMDLSTPCLVSPPPQSKKKAAALQHRGAASNLPLGVQSKSRWRRPFQSRKKQHMLNSSANNDPVNQLDAMKLPSGVEQSFWEDKTKNNVGTSSFDSSSFPVHVDMSNHPPGLKSSLSWSQSPFKTNIKPTFFNHTGHLNFYDPMVSYHPQDMTDPWFDNIPHSLKNDAAVGSSANNVQATSSMDREEIMRKFQLFKQFDTVEDHSDHHYARNGSSLKHSSKSWAKRIQEEWKILEKDLPGQSLCIVFVFFLALRFSYTIFVRVYETRMDLLRAVIVGAEGTPYHDGLFFFDVFFPSNYPNVPPHFEDFVVGHFCNRAHDILVACKAYMDGAQVGCLVKGGVQDVDEGDKSCSKQFKDSLSGYVDRIVKEFSRIGANDCEKFLSPTVNLKKQTGSTSHAAP
ncbi:Ubiquitin-fold modifier-conjugating enzyme [Trema orientale]|uniref:Ubiquitin-fold modifier-conjugating enzyme n=1 Tax=Trema orientale TaxID=63057 RepID=A0A2P5F047_TREOI|nr:Ubiquitin-fold modifier-conjugating enzyme [Trema orientale]